MLEIVFDDRARNDLLALPKIVQKKIFVAVEKKLCKYPELFGTRLRGKLKDYWKLRVGDYRIGYIPGKKRVIIRAIGNRKDVYRILERRIQA